MQRIVRPEGWPRPRGYSDGVVSSGRVLFVAGQNGTTPDGRLAAGGLVAETEQALRNIVAVVAAAGGKTTDVTRLTWYVTDIAAYRREQGALGRAYRAVMGAHYPAMTLVAVSAFVNPDACVEIEATAVLTEGA